ncbi:MAG: hypothetical protein ACI837_001141 [Crocinitomicaceae bacterium]|jgi:hypothetical protein
MSTGIKEQLVTDGQIEFGLFSTPIRNVNFLDALIFPGYYTPQWFKNLRLKEFQAFQGGNKDFFFFLTLFNAKVSAFAQIRVFDIRKKKHYVYEKQLMPNALKIPNGILNSTNSYHGKTLSIEIENKLEGNYVKLKFSALKTKEMPAIEAEVRGNFEFCEQMVVSIPFAENRGMYAHKGITSMQGSLKIDEESHSFETDESFFILDDHKGYYPYIMRWDWLTTAFLHEGKMIGINLTKNQSLDNEKHNENGIWIDGKLTKLNGVEFLRDGDRWTIKDSSGTIDLVFTSLYPKSVKINLGPLGRSNYQGPMGEVSGTLLVGNEKIVIDKEFALAEDQYLRC